MQKEEFIDKLINLAIQEDIGDGDHTSLATIQKLTKGNARLLVKENSIIAGVEIAEKVFQKIDSTLAFDVNLSDGTPVNKGDFVFTVKGNVHSILQAERLVLNIMQRMSGIATQTSVYANEIKDLKTKVLDTRKTTPGMRMLDKMAVKIGGGENHRIGLFDMIMIKDNHVDYAGGIKDAIKNTLSYLKNTKRDLKIEIETRNFDEIQQVLEVGNVHRIMLDNFSVSDTQKAVELINGRYETEASGGITLKNLRNYAECGVDYISVGALTHQIKSIDLSLKAFS